MAIFAGFMIGIGAIVYLSVGEVAGALLFAVGLLSICHFKGELFTGKVGGLLTGKISISELLRIWFGNLTGCFAAAACLILTPRYDALQGLASAVVETRVANGPIVNLLLGVFCGVLMYIAVTGYAQTKNVAFIFVPIATFILSGFNHCVADMMYLMLGAWEIGDFAVLIPTTIGNAVGGSVMGWIDAAASVENRSD